jgi:hypothetical protein
MTVDYLKRQKTVRELHKKVESTPGSGWHLRDPGAEKRDHETKLSERPIAIQEDDKIHIVGEDAVKVLAGLRAYETKMTPLLNDDMPLFKKRTLKAITRVLESKPDPNHFTVGTQTWNYCVNALADMGIHCCITDLNE